ncbi:MAG TPA: hypothetical protein VI670_10680 [Thermoanaerobaculia bacterium]|jgi:hypothetical protein
MKKGIMLAVSFALVSMAAQAQVCGRVNGTLAVPTITTPATCAGGAIVSKPAHGLYKLSLRSGTITTILVTPISPTENGDYIATVRRADNATVFVRTYRMGRACPPNVSIETACAAANVTREDVDFSFEIR